MKIEDSTVDKIAELAKLELDENSRANVKADLIKMLDFVDKLNELDTEGVEPLIFMTDEPAVLRPDVVKMDITQKEALQNAPKKDSDYIRVPKVLEKE